MKKTLRSKIGALSLSLSLLLNFFPATNALASYSFHVKNYSNYPTYVQYSPDISGTKVVYTEADGSYKGAPLSVKIYDVNANTSYLISHSSHEIYSGDAKIDNNKVVYTVYDGTFSQIVIVDITNPENPVHYQITSTNSFKSEVDISGNGIVFVSSVESGQSYVSNVFFADITNVSQPDIYQLTSNDQAQIHYHDSTISGRKVAWSVESPSGNDITYEDVTIPSLPDGPYSIATDGLEYLPEFDGNNLVYLEVDEGFSTAT